MEAGILHILDFIEEKTGESMDGESLRAAAISEAAGSPTPSGIPKEVAGISRSRTARYLAECLGATDHD